MTIAGTTSNSLASLLSSTLSSVNSNNSSSSNNPTGSPISTGPIDVNTLVSQLIQADSQPLFQLQQQQSSVQSKLSAYGQIQSAVSSLQTATQALTLGSGFSAEQASVSGSGVAAQVSGTPLAGTYSVTVSQLAQAQTSASASISGATTATAVGTGTFSLQVGTNAPVNITIDSSNDTLGGIASAINSASAGVNASVVTDTTGSRIVLTATNTGAANAFTATFANGGSPVMSFATAQPAQDAQFSVNGVNLTSASNSVTSAVNGLTLNLTQAPAAGSTLQSQVTVSTNTSAITQSVNSFVSAYNSLVNLEKNLTSYNSSTNSASVLTGDMTTMQIGSQLSSILGGQINGGTSGYSWLADVGVDFNQDGTLALNTTTFSNALAANPSAVSQMFTSVSGTGNQQGFATQLNNALSAMLSPNGLVTSAQTSTQAQITDLGNRITATQQQLSQEQTQLITQYSQLNASLVVAQQQQTALANALSTLP